MFSVAPTIAVEKYFYRGEEYDATQEIEKVKVRMHVGDHKLKCFSLLSLVICLQFCFRPVIDMTAEVHTMSKIDILLRISCNSHQDM